MLIKAPFIKGQRTISPGHGTHKQDLRFQHLQQTGRRTVKFWSLLDFCAKPNCFFEVGYVLIMVSRFPTNHPINSWICDFICCLSILFDLSQPHFPLSPTRRKEIIIFPGTLKYLRVKENTEISVQWSWNLEAVKFYIIQSLLHTEIPNSTEAGNCYCWENAGKESCWHALHTSSSSIPVSPNFNSRTPRQGNKLGLTADCGLCLIAAIAGGGQTHSLVSYQVSALPDPKRTSMKENYWFFVLLVNQNQSPTHR